MRHNDGARALRFSACPARASRFRRQQKMRAQRKEATLGSSRSKPLPRPSTFLSLGRESLQWSCLPFDYPSRRSASVFQHGWPPVKFNSGLLNGVVQFHKYRPRLGIVFWREMFSGAAFDPRGSFCVVPHDPPIHFLCRLKLWFQTTAKMLNIAFFAYGLTKNRKQN